MKLYLIAFVLLALDPIGKLDRVAKQNALKKEAKAAFMEEDFKTAIEKYSYLHDSLNVRDDNILLNLATAQYKVADQASALSNYQKLTASADKNIRSVAYQQLGIMNNTPQQQQKALDYFKKALKANPANEEARYNYELLKKQDQQNDDKNEDQQKEEKDQEKQDQQKDSQEKDQQEKDQQQQEQEQGDKQDQEQKDQQQDQQEQDKEQQEQSQEQQEADEKKNKEQQEGQAEQDDSEGKKDEKEEIPPSTHKKLQEMKISPEKAKMILEAMKNQEVQYIQQNKKKARKRAKNGKPDW